MAANKISSNSFISALAYQQHQQQQKKQQYLLNGNNILVSKCAEITAIYFDLDNTLIPTRSGDAKAIRKLSEVLEVQFYFTKDESTLATQAFLKAFRRYPDNSQTSLDSWRTYLWRESLPQRYKHLAEQIYAKWLLLRYHYLALTNDYIQLLKRLRKMGGYVLALITNGPSKAQWEKVQKLNIEKYFDCILVSSDLPWEKPHPNIFYAACNILNVKPSQCAMIGDKLETDIKGGHLANLGLTFWIPLNYNGMDDLSDVKYPPHIILNNLLEIYKYFPKLNAATGGHITLTIVGAGGGAAAAGVSATAAAATKVISNSQLSGVGSTTTSTCDSGNLRK